MVADCCPEKIHTNERPHACAHPGCNRRFIQRSALTVHIRVHTGEKPHHCDTCKKVRLNHVRPLQILTRWQPFSDSSSLARHRRIHTGKRPYTCPQMSCQKTFTRKTTMKRHLEQSHPEHQDVNCLDSTRLSNESTSSRGTTVSPSERRLSASPLEEHVTMATMQRSTLDHGYHSQPSLPPHLRTDFQPQYSPRSTPSLSGPSLASFTSNPLSKPSPTSHPNAYGPPQPLEPPANGTVSGSASPHMGWGSPSHGGIGSPGGLHGYDYPDATFSASSLFFPTAGIRRPQSTEPQDYGIRPRGAHAQALTHTHDPVSMPMTTDWSNMPSLQDIKQESRVW